MISRQVIGDVATYRDVPHSGINGNLEQEGKIA